MATRHFSGEVKLADVQNVVDATIDIPSAEDDAFEMQWTVMRLLRHHSWNTLRRVTIRLPLNECSERLIAVRNVTLYAPPGLEELVVTVDADWTVNEDSPEYPTALKLDAAASQDLFARQDDHNSNSFGSAFRLENLTTVRLDDTEVDEPFGNMASTCQELTGVIDHLQDFCPRLSTIVAYVGLSVAQQVILRCGVPNVIFRGLYAHLNVLCPPDQFSDDEVEHWEQPLSHIRSITFDDRETTFDEIVQRSRDEYDTSRIDVVGPLYTWFPNLTRLREVTSDRKVADMEDLTPRLREAAPERVLTARAERQRCEPYHQTACVAIASHRAHRLHPLANSIGLVLDKILAFAYDSVPTPPQAREPLLFEQNGRARQWADRLVDSRFGRTLLHLAPVAAPTVATAVVAVGHKRSHACMSCV